MDRQVVWRLICESSLAHARSTARWQPEPFAALIEPVAERFCAQSAPDSETEMAIRHTQALAVITIIGGVAHAASMARNRPEAAKELYNEAQKLSQCELPRSEAESKRLRDEAMVLISASSAICHKHRMNQI